ncbi:MAG: nucleoside-diphosphate kinase [Muribaculaceae bacterium]|nr:nucleoside-diphosphate kinase [Muribaculaceae bacterium]
MESTLVLIKPSGVERALIGRIIARFESKGLIIAGLKMMQLDEKILREHYSHLVDKPFFPSLLNAMMASPVIALCLKGKDVVEVVRAMAGVTDASKALPGTIRGDFGMSNQENIIHASDSPENATTEIKRFFHDKEIFDYTPCIIKFLYSPDGK